MIIINKNKTNKEYQIPEMPNFQSRKLKVLWLRRQRMETIVTNIKSVSVQVKDIKQMIYSENPKLISLYAFLQRHNSYNDEDYITISKYKKGNKPKIYALINADWLINIDEINNKSIDEIENECIELENIIEELKNRKKERNTSISIDDRIKLLQYKLLCLHEYLSKKEIINKTDVLSKKLKPSETIDNK